MSPTDETGVPVRRLHPDDAAAYRPFRLRELRRSPSAFTSTHTEESAHPLSWWVERLAGPDVVLGAFDATASLVGTAGLSLFTRRQERHKGTLFGMAVAAHVAGRGIGRQLVQEVLAEARCRNLLQVALTVSAGNTVAGRLYRSCGFEVWGHEPRAVMVEGRAITKVHMVRILDDYRTS